MALHLARTFLPAIQTEEADAALVRVLASEGCRIERSLSHDEAAWPRLIAGLGPGVRLLTRRSPGPDGAGWVLDESLPRTEGASLWLAEGLSLETGGFGIGVEASHSLGRGGLSACWAGQVVEQRTCRPEDSSPAEIDRVVEDFGGLFALLSRQPPARLALDPSQPLHSLVVSGWPAHRAGRQPGRGGLALALFALAAPEAFAAAWGELEPCLRNGWRWRAANTASAAIDHVLLSRYGGPDSALCERLARRLDVPAVAVATHAPAAPFDWWRVQPGEAAHAGQGQGMADFLLRLMPAMAVLGESPGVLRI